MGNQQREKIFHLSEFCAWYIATPLAIYSGNVADGMDLVVAGWGYASTEPTGGSRNELSTITLLPSSSSDCKELYPFWSDNSKNVVCTLIKDGKCLDIVNGGNPLV
ncbi:hypothetical protein AX774_g1166 [Zancudomyces culisetae]|uniref:Peptidase S1 domain-containing protein n=1 Tax=Zancudomyces culisetae TaxID=1213189 RepID=A0A1R1PWG1_ZANCU|nr:hypothetical protein AX774_g1166 [Zancudomyces culisetae]|eukprot:OMH85288.1 hypothetical protein AX774_g1166 [Zancudomyces culisetae]